MIVFLTFMRYSDENTNSQNSVCVSISCRLPDGLASDPRIIVPVFISTMHIYLDDLVAEPELGPTLVRCYDRFPFSQFPQRLCCFRMIFDALIHCHNDVMTYAGGPRFAPSRRAAVKSSNLWRPRAAASSVSARQRNALQIRRLARCERTPTVTTLACIHGTT